MLKIEDNVELTRYILYLRRNKLIYELLNWAVEHSIAFRLKLGTFLRKINFTNEAIRVYESLLGEIESLYIKDSQKWA
ncbi:MAG: hypothetical protein ABDH18_00685 [Aquificaceae bacterium]